MSLIRSTRHTDLLHQDNALLIVVDMQEPFLRNIWERERVIAQTILLIEAAKTLRLPIVPTLQYADRMGDIIPEIARAIPRGYTPFDKLTFSAMANEAIASEIHRSGRKQVILCGIETHICIHQTAHDLLAHGIQVHIAADAVSSRTECNWQTGLRRMENSGALISSTEMAIYELLVEAGNHDFREIQKHVK